MGRSLGTGALRAEVMLRVSVRQWIEELSEGVIAPALDPEDFEREELLRYRFNIVVACVAEAIPRRLGDVPQSLLAQDKKLARRIANAYRVALVRAGQMSRRGGGKEPDVGDVEVRTRLARSAGDSARRVGATIRWDEWIPETILDGELKRREIAALGKELGLNKWTWRRIRVLDEELSNLRRIEERSPNGRA